MLRKPREPIAEWTEDDQCYVDTCPGLMIGGVHGDDEAKVLLRIGSELHKKIAIEALKSGKSLNSFCVQKLRE